MNIKCEWINQKEEIAILNKNKQINNNNIQFYALY